MFFAGEKRVKEGAAEVSPRRFRHEGTKTLRNTKWECFCGDGRRGEKSKGGYAEMIFFVGRFRHEFVSSWFVSSWFVSPRTKSSFMLQV